MTVKPMLAKDGDPSNLTYPVAVQHKLDGIRAMVVDGKLVSRTLKPIPNAEIREALERWDLEGLDGEIIVGEPTDAGCMQRTSSFVMAPSKRGEPWTFYAFDKWNEAGVFAHRYHRVSEIAEQLTWTDVPVAALSYVIAHNENDLAAFEAEAIELGHEGIIVRTLDAPYKFGRSGKRGPLLKIKRFIDFEAEVIGVYEEMHNGNEAGTNALGRTERSTKKAGLSGKGRLGGLILRAVNGPHAGQEFRCGTGFSADQREDFWNIARFGTGHAEAIWDNQSGLNGRYAKIKSFPIGVKDAPRFPVWLGWRSKEDFDI